MYPSLVDLSGRPLNVRFSLVMVIELPEKADVICCICSTDKASKKDNSLGVTSILASV